LTKKKLEPIKRRLFVEVELNKLNLDGKKWQRREEDTKNLRTDPSTYLHNHKN